jgi:hypothetical protein
MKRRSTVGRWDGQVEMIFSQAEVGEEDKCDKRNRFVWRHLGTGTQRTAFKKDQREARRIPAEDAAAEASHFWLLGPQKKVTSGGSAAPGNDTDE